MKQYMLSEENMEYKKLMDVMLGHLSGKVRFQGKEFKNIPRLSILSDMIPGLSFLLFDNRDLNQVLPNGFVTENIVAIPFEIFKKFSQEIDKKSDIMNCEYDLAKFFFSYMKPLVEKNFNFTFDKNSEDEVMKVFEGTKTNLDSIIFNNNPVVISNKELAKLIENKEFKMLEELLEDSKGFNPQKLLKINPQQDNSFNELRLLLSGLDKNYQKISVKDFRDKCANHFNNVDNLRFVLKEMNELIKKSDNNPYVFLENSDEFINYALSLNELQFKAVMSEVVEKVIGLIGKKELWHEQVGSEEVLNFKTKLGEKIASNPYCNMDMREVLIVELSGLNAFELYGKIKKRVKLKS